MSRERGGSPLRQAGQAQAGDEEFENFRCQKVSVPAKEIGDGQLGVDGKHPAEFGACLVQPAEMRQGDGFDPHRWGQPRLVVQGAGPPFGAACGGAQDDGTRLEGRAMAPPRQRSWPGLEPYVRACINSVRYLIYRS